MRATDRLLLIAAAGAAGLCALGPEECRAQGFMADITSRMYTVAPGDTVSGVIQVTSTVEEPVELSVYAATAVRGVEAAEGYQYSSDPAREPRSLLPWLSFSPSRLALAPWETKEVAYEIHVPEDSRLDGSYWATIFVSSESANAVPPEPGADDVDLGIKVHFRYATFVAVTIAGTEQSRAEFTKLELQPGDSRPSAMALASNTGNCVVKLGSWLELRDTAGATVYSSKPGASYILPESGRLLKYEIDAPLPAGEYLLMVIGDYGAPKLIAAQGRVEITSAESRVMQEAVQPPSDAGEPEAGGVDPAPPTLPPGAQPGADDQGTDGDHPQ